jgi:hypothetical protein
MWCCKKTFVPLNVCAFLHTVYCSLLRDTENLIITGLYIDDVVTKITSVQRGIEMRDIDVVHASTQPLIGLFFFCNNTVSVNHLQSSSFESVLAMCLDGSWCMRM